MSSFFNYALNRALYNSIKSFNSSNSSRQPNFKEQSQKDSEKLNQASILLDKDAKQLNIDAENLKKAENQIKEDAEHLLTYEHFLYYALTGKVKKGVTLSQDEIDLMEKTFKEIKEEVKDEPSVKIAKDY